MYAPAASARSSANANANDLAAALACATAARAAGTKRAFPGADAHAGRRVLPRHFHDGPNPPATAASGSSGTAAAVGTRPASRLYRHALESIFAFLKRIELVSALQVSHDWLDAVKSMGRQEWRHPNPSSVPPHVIALSAMARHFLSLGSDRTPVPLNADTLAVFTSSLGHLRQLACQLSLSPQFNEPLFFLAALKKLHLELQGPVSVEQVNVVIEGVGKLPQLDQLYIILPAANSQISFSPLVALPLLRNLAIILSRGGKFSDAQVDQLRSMPRLQRLFTHMTTELLRRLLRQPHSLQWQEISLLHDPLGDEECALLPQLPSLTRLETVTSCARFGWLRGLPKLTHVDLTFVGLGPGFHGPPAAGRVDSLVTSLRRCTAVTSLSLRCAPDLTAEHLAYLLPRLPRLASLRLHWLDIASLAFLAQEPMVRQLAHLDIVRCLYLPLTELRHVIALRALRSLKNLKSFSEPMDPHCLSLYQPPTVLLPRLHTFAYKPPTLWVPTMIAPAAAVVGPQPIAHADGDEEGDAANTNLVVGNGE